MLVEVHFVCMLIYTCPGVQLLWSRQVLFLRCKVYLVVLWVILASKQLFFHGSNSPFLAFVLTRFWSSWKQLYWMISHTGTNCRPMMRRPYHCPSRPPASLADMFMETVLVKNCKVSISWCMCANSVCVCVCVCHCKKWGVHKKKRRQQFALLFLLFFRFFFLSKWLTIS